MNESDAVGREVVTMSKRALLTVSAILLALPAVRAADEWAGADLVIKVDTEYAPATAGATSCAARCGTC
ncbi:MAG TPA: hypothetical protein VM054_00350 [bacterium]|nr:hypothetical protein [bacterium]